ncbi:hypothetical protein JM84_3053 [Dokdonia sp. Hel_I_63]|uniref:hypothetical protein n=1 Tax=Dokdonia sp. Hel_I_63 TaxID=1249996 RepID=UPI00119AEEBE|nr:hypothetical protein [Dokdonia sp. Hel_I_63]TVZ24094.1 hypothetical protein JM84_3053 [Dokdonia sp. Hel_I_63]
MKSFGKIVLLVVIAFVFYMAKSFISFRNNENEQNKSTIYSPEGKKCAYITSEKAYSYKVEICRSEFITETAWLNRIREVEKAKKYDEFGNSYYVSITYK